MLLSAFDRLDAGKLPPEAELDLLTAAGTRKSGPIAQRLKKYDAAHAKSADKDPLTAYRPCLIGGDARRGETIFRDRLDVSCLRCHSTHGVGGNAGPDLAGVLKRAGPDYRNPREYILESILYPNKKIAPGFETVTLNTGDDVVSGVLKGEDDKQITLDVPNVGLTKVDKSTVKSRKGGLSAMPEDIAKTLSKQDLRDLVEFLSGVE
jgi:quinoprotein glucose dehydrogenase